MGDIKTSRAAVEPAESEAQYFCWTCLPESLQMSLLRGADI